MKILKINTFDSAGGAERIATVLQEGLQSRDCESWLFVGRKFTDKINVFEFPSRKNKFLLKIIEIILTLPQTKLTLLIIKILNKASMPITSHLCNVCGIEDFEFSNSQNVYKMAPSPPDIIHAHNLHGNYFNLRALPSLSTQFPLLITLHDAWLLSGHCAHSFSCNRWLTGCGSCPYLSVYPGISRDASAYNWKRKKRIYSKSHLYIATPSQWLLNKVNNSILQPSIQLSKVIPNGVDTSIFKPADKVIARSTLRLPLDKKIILAVGNELKNNPWKDYDLMEKAIQMVGTTAGIKDILFIVLGQDLPEYTWNNIEYQFIQIKDRSERLALYYQASDVYIHAARADTFPTTILESMACGCPVIATQIGGIPEQIINEVTGLLVPPSDVTYFANSLRNVLENTELSQYLSKNASAIAQKEFNLEKMVTSYLNYYEEIIDHRKRIGYKTNLPINQINQ